MDLNETFSAEDEELTGEGNFAALPAGWYSVGISEAELKDTKTGTGQYIKMKLDILDGEKAGRVLFTNLNIRNQNEMAEKIGKQQLGSVMRATGLAKLSNTDELIGGQMQVKVKVTKSEQYGDDDGNQNEVTAFKSLNESTAPAPAAGAAKPAATKAAPPWAKK